ncbi:hypothetical protein FHS26_006911 [Rhizobium pisi]|uniref:Uncharacterized protein n=1 Tax=Rhizobium pisi TaxID=574561 RepID=A0A7W5BU86_9HYPH|nr:hypothetical protein [Rhizobium pisi]
MPGYYGADGASRPCHDDCHGPDEHDTGRFFLCERCRGQVLICRCCDRGQIYCAGGCARVARAERRREVVRRYQTSRNGRFAHAARSRRYRARHNKVTHHGSLASDADVDVMAASVTTPNEASDTSDTPSLTEFAIANGLPTGGLGHHCHWCGRCCSPFLRREPLRRRRAIPMSLSRG